MLEVRTLSARYGAVPAVRVVDLDVAPGELVAIVGPNGAGKSTLLRSIMGQHGEHSGTVVVDGADVSGVGAVGAARAGIAIVPQGRRLFPSLSVDEHLHLSRSRAAAGAITIDEVIEFFPGLGWRRSVRASALSGGEQQMLAIARAVLMGPRYVLMDEPTEGLAPMVVDSVARLVEHLPTVGIGVLVSDQDDSALVQRAARTYDMVRGEVAVRPATQRAVHVSHQQEEASR